MRIVAFFALFSASAFSLPDLDKQKGEQRMACTKTGIAFQNQPEHRLNSTTRLAALRELMETEFVQAYIVTSTDEHMNSEVDDYEKRIKYISGFGGSHAIAVITKDKAALWIDNRYHLQADEQIDCNWLLFRDGYRHVSKITEWLRRELPPGRRVGLDPKLVSEYLWNKLDSSVRGTLYLIPQNVDLIDRIWPQQERGWRRSTKAFPLDKQHTGKGPVYKIDLLRSELRKYNSDAIVITALDEVAWLLNVRAKDLPYVPVLRSYVILDMNNVYLYVNSSQISDARLQSALHMDAEIIDEFTVQTRHYDEFWTDLRDLTQKYRAMMIPSHCVHSEGANHAVLASIYKNTTIVSKPSPIIFLKSAKNPTEAKAMEAANIIDAAAFCECFARIEKMIRSGENVTELHVLEGLNYQRSEHSLGNSFRPIIAFGTSSAHSFHEPSDTIILRNGTLLVETGAQYLNGTTDLVRTFHFGKPTPDMKTAYTRALIGLIQLSSLTFPSNMKMAVADALARASLWEVQLDYMHDTGHGVGAFLNVEESPVKVRFDSDASAQQVFKRGYFLTIEPGIYREGEFGIKLGNVMEVVEKPWLKQSGHTFLGFKTITYVPFEPSLLQLSLLSPLQRKWLNNYNEQIRQIVGAELKSQKKMDGFYWMMEKTRFIPERGRASITSNHYLWLISINVFLIKLLT